MAALRTASRLGRDASEANVLQDSNRVVLRLKPCDVVTRVHAGADKRESLAT